MHSKTLSSRVIGFVASLILTGGAFLIVLNHQFFHLDVNMAINVILGLALLQFVVQSIFFLNLLSEKAPRWNLVVFASTLSVLIIIIAGSIWIMHHLNDNMMLGY